MLVDVHDNDRLLSPNDTASSDPERKTYEYNSASEPVHH